MTQKDTVLDALTTTPPKWVAKFQQQNYDAGRLPFILIYRARGIMKTIPKKNERYCCINKSSPKRGCST